MSPRGKLLLIGLGIAVGSPLVALKLISATGEAPERPEVVTSLPGCPASPNCVCSQEADGGHAIAPLNFAGDPAAAVDRLKDVIAADGGRLVRADARYLHFEYRSRLFRFVDDVEFLLVAEQRRIEVRSASRSGRSDLGVNRQRVERIRARFAKASAK